MAGLADLGALRGRRRVWLAGCYRRVTVCGAARERGGEVAFVAGGKQCHCCYGGKISLLLSSVENIITSTSWHVIFCLIYYCLALA